MHPIHLQKSDKELWDLLRQNNKTAFSLLYKRHIKALIQFGRKLTTDQELIKDQLQELFVEIWNKRSSLVEVEQVKIYLIKALRYKLLRAISKSNKSQVYRLEDLLTDFSELDLMEEEVSQERKKLIKIQLQQLPERQREVIHLRYYQNLKNEEIAEIININYQSVANLLHRALTKLKKNCLGYKPKSSSSLN